MKTFVIRARVSDGREFEYEQHTETAREALKSWFKGVRARRSCSWASVSTPEACPCRWSVLKTAALPLSYLDIAWSRIAITGMSPNAKVQSGLGQVQRRSCWPD